MSKDKIAVATARRKNVRDLHSPFGNDFRKYLAEIITNSDDSYKRLEVKGILSKDEIKNIKIRISKHKDGFSINVYDQAEGLFKESIDSIFGFYGGDNSGGSDVKSRGIFGQGASDVLFNSSFNKYKSTICSIKDGIACKATFYLNDDLERFIDTEIMDTSSQNKLNQLRQGWKIPNNGTRITFGVKKDIVSTNLETLKNEIESYYVFRKLFYTKNRRVSLEFLDNEEIILDSSKYQFIEENLVQEKTNFNIQYDNTNINANITLYNSQKKIKDSKIITIDTNGVIYSNNLFKFDNDPRAKNLHGYLEIPDLYMICSKYLNSDEPSAILTDTRDGFDSKHGFYKALQKAIAPIISDTLNKISDNGNEVDITDDKSFMQALNKINKYLSNQIEDEITGGGSRGISVPSDGLRFVRNEISISKGRKYSLKLLINTKLIKMDDIILLDIFNNEGDFINTEQNSIFYTLKDLHKSVDNLATKNITIEGLNTTFNCVRISAVSGEFKTNLLVNVIEEQIHYPKNGLEFYADTIRVKPSSEHHGNLYFDTNIHPLNSKVSFLFSSGIKLQYNSYILQKKDLLTSTIGLVKVPFITQAKEMDATIVASIGEIFTKLAIAIRKKAEQPIASSGLIAGFKYIPQNAYWQSYFDPMDKYIKILSDNPINLAILGDTKNKGNTKIGIKEKKGLCDIISEEVSILLVNKLIEKGKMSFITGGHEQYVQKLKEEKNNIFNMIYHIL